MCVDVCLFYHSLLVIIYTIFFFSYLVDISCENEFFPCASILWNQSNQCTCINLHFLYRDDFGFFFHTSFKLLTFDFRFSCFIYNVSRTQHGLHTKLKINTTTTANRSKFTGIRSILFYSRYFLFFPMYNLGTRVLTRA